MIYTYLDNDFCNLLQIFLNLLNQYLNVTNDTIRIIWPGSPDREYLSILWMMQKFVIFQIIKWEDDR